ncbi:hypothetical protein GCM10010910_01490 [Microbacterium nanhaiense]|uniref:Uncharacterized protein n=1 Tax=Microbacterium nanhaiense TaxID=1301026 RepID=A0ABQ2MWP6_9MICO|nr:hypothetical protein [Microbacterium nanhaiense]GGO59167.1 hypothetical protein GCM10010910_01490 [Microbacterium nanhaiense]
MSDKPIIRDNIIAPSSRGEASPNAIRTEVAATVDASLIRDNIVQMTTDIATIRRAVLDAVKEEFGGTYSGEDIARRVVSTLAH